MESCVPNGAGWEPLPKTPKSILEYYDSLMKMTERLSGVPQLPMRFIEDGRVPKDQVWLIDSLGKVHKIINIANYLDDNSAISLCVGEMK